MKKKKKSYRTYALSKLFSIPEKIMRLTDKPFNTNPQ